MTRETREKKEEDEGSVCQNRSARGEVCTEAIYYSAYRIRSEQNKIQHQRAHARKGDIQLLLLLTLVT